jgi:predicted GIY-YIG superfamily endonuclease
MNTAMTVEKDIKMQYKSAWKQEFLFKHDKKWQNIGIIVNVDNDMFHV